MNGPRDQPDLRAARLSPLRGASRVAPALGRAAYDEAMSLSQCPQRAAAGLLALLAVVVLVGCGERDPQPPAARFEDPGPIHVHGLGVNPADGALFVATHSGLFRAAEGQRRARRVGGRLQDTMGFTVTGPNRFLGSGHPDLREKLPPFLGLIESDDGGRSWRSLSLQGEVDFHVLEAGGRRIYGYGSDFDSREPRFLASVDGGRSWRRLDPPALLIALAISPTDARTVIVSGGRRVFSSRNGGRSWSPVEAPSAGLLAWNTGGLYLAGSDGRVWRSNDDGASWQDAAEVGGRPAAFGSGRGDELLVALHDGTIKRSGDRGGGWAMRSEP